MEISAEQAIVHEIHRRVEPVEKLRTNDTYS